MLLTDLMPTLQLAISPVILISGIGLLLLSITNRFGRVIDRSRLLIHDLKGASEPGRIRIHEEIRILSMRAKWIRGSVVCAAFSLLLIAILIIVLFLGLLFLWNMAGVVIGLFILCMIGLLAALVLFIIDINLSLKALWIEMSP